MSSKNSRVKIHVGRNQKFTSKNSRAKNSHGRQGLFPWACFVGLFFPWSCCVPWSCSRGRVPCFNACKGKHNKRQQQHKKRLQIKIFNNIMI